MTSVTRRNAITGLVSTLSCPAIAGLQLQPDFDVLIVGAGAAGIAAARRVAVLTDVCNFGGQRPPRWPMLHRYDAHLICPMIRAHIQSTYQNNPHLSNSRPKITSNCIQIQKFNRSASSDEKGSSEIWRRFIPIECAATQQFQTLLRAKMTYHVQKHCQKTSATGARTMEFILGPYRFGADLKDLSAKEYAAYYLSKSGSAVSSRRRLSYWKAGNWHTN